MKSFLFLAFQKMKKPYLSKKLVFVMKRLISLLFILAFFPLAAQKVTGTFEKYPVFPECKNENINSLKNCFENTLRSKVFSSFQIPEVVSEENYKGNVSVFFEVTKEGVFKVLYVDAMYNELKDETRRVFNELQQIAPATYNSDPAYVQFTMTIPIPIKDIPLQTEEVATETQKVSELKKEYDAIENLPYENEEYTSQINIPFSHHNYSLLDPALNRVGQNNHTAQKPYIYSQVNKYYDFEAENAKLLKVKSSWFGRKLWNEHLVTIKGDKYWITLDAGVDLQAGKDFDGEIQFVTGDEWKAGNLSYHLKSRPVWEGFNNSEILKNASQFICVEDVCLGRY